MSLSLANCLTIQPKSGVIMVIGYQLHIFIVKVGKADNDMDNVLQALQVV